MTTRKETIDQYEIPKRDGLAVRIADANSCGTDVYWSEQRDCYVFVDHDRFTVATADRVVLVRGGDIDQLLAHDAIGLDLDAPDGLALVGLTAGETLDVGDVTVLWDSGAES